MAINQETRGSGRRATLPSHEGVYDDVRVVATCGVGHSNLRADQLTDLLCAARIICDGDADTPADDHEREVSDLETIVHALGHAAYDLGGRNAKSVLALLGLTDETRGRLLAERRERAVQEYTEPGKKPATRETFRAHHEKMLLIEVARRICRLADEQFLKDWQVQLESRSGGRDIASESATPRQSSRDETFAEVQPPFGHKLSDDFAGIFLEDEDDLRRARAALVPTTRPAVVRRIESAEPDEPETVAEALIQIGEGLGSIFSLIVEPFEQTSYRTRVSRGTGRSRSQRRTVRVSTRPRLQVAVELSLLLTTIFLICATLVGAFVILRFFANLIVSI